LSRMRPPEAGLRVPPERYGQGPVITLPWGTIGDLATAAFVVAAASGVGVAVPYDTQDAYGSIAAMLLANPAERSSATCATGRVVVPQVLAGPLWITRDQHRASV
jgi:hypothetical protein